jgi:hypothetical protein
MAMNAPLREHHVVVGTCPRCGSTAFTKLRAKRKTADTNDRECKDCGTRYTTIPAPLSSTVQTAMYASGVALIGAGVQLAVLWLAAMQGPGRMSGATYPLYGVFFSVMACATYPLYGVFFSVMAGIRVLRMPQQAQQFREKRLKEYHASAPPGAPPAVEMPRVPDMVFLSGLFGTLALAAPLFSSLLMVVLFGPAGVVCGVVALSQGHLKGLIGLVLAVVGLIVWGLLLVCFFQG